MNEFEATDFVILELNGEVDKSKELTIYLAQKAIQSIR